MKTVYALCIILVLISAGCSGKKEVKPSEDSLRTKEAMEAINTIQKAYQEKNREVLALHIHPVIAKNIVNELSFEKVDLYFTPWIVRIKESSTIINADWQGTWLYENREIKRRGIADFVFIDNPMKLVHINGDNPFYIRPVDFEDEKQDVQPEPLESEKAPPAEDEEKIEPSVQPAEDEEKLEPAVRPAEDEEKLEPAVQPAEDEDVTGQPAPVPAPEPAMKGDETSGLQPLKRTKLLYREHDLIPTEQPKAVQAEDQNKYIVQVGAWKSSPNAQGALDLVRGFYPEALIVEEGGFHKIRIKKIMSRREGMLAIEDLEDKFNFNPVLIGLDVPSTESRSVEPVATDSHEYFIQIGVWRNPEFAKTALADLRESYPEAVIIRTTNFHKVGIPVTISREKANALVNEIKVKLKSDAILIEK